MNLAVRVLKVDTIDNFTVGHYFALIRPVITKLTETKWHLLYLSLSTAQINREFDSRTKCMLACCLRPDSFESTASFQCTYALSLLDPHRMYMDLRAGCKHHHGFNFDSSVRWFQETLIRVIQYRPVAFRPSSDTNNNYIKQQSSIICIYTAISFSYSLRGNIWGCMLKFSYCG